MVVLLIPAVAVAAAGVGDPQIRTDHPWYPGELACSTFDRLFATQAEAYKRVTGRDCTIQYCRPSKHHSISCGAP